MEESVLYYNIRKYRNDLTLLQCDFAVPLDHAHEEDIVFEVVFLRFSEIFCLELNWKTKVLKGAFSLTSYFSYKQLFSRTKLP